jgi:hypothetical protein
MYRSIVAVYARLPDAPVLRRELEDSGVPPSQVHISTEEEPVPATSLPAHEPRGFTDWLFGVPENDLSFFRESLEAGRTVVKVHVAADLADEVSQMLERFGPLSVEMRTARAAPEGSTASVRSYVVELPFEDLVRQRAEQTRAGQRETVLADEAGAPSRHRR